MSGAEAQPWGNSITKVVIEEGVASVGLYAFYGCSRLTDVSLPESLKSIEAFAFPGCSSLKEITVPENVNKIENNSFNNCRSLININVVKENGSFSSLNGVLFNKNQTVLIKYPAGKQQTVYTVPGTVTEIGGNAFAGAAKLADITLPDSINKIGLSAFSGTAFYNRKNFVNGVLYLGKCVIDVDTNITYCHLREGTEVIAEGAFLGCSKLKSIIIPTSVTAVDTCCFMECGALETVYLPKSITAIGKSAFSGCSKLQNVWYGGDVSKRNYMIIEPGNEPLRNINWKYNVCQTGGEHTWVGIKTVPASCVNDGTKTERCKVCGEEVTTNIPHVGHIIGDWIETKPATCETNGEQRRNCANCSYSESMTIPALGHVFKNPVITKAATCTEDGIETGMCIRCNKTATGIIKATGHKYGEWVIIKEATESDTGIKERVCACGHKETAVIGKIGGGFINDGEDEEDYDAWNEQYKATPKGRLPIWALVITAAVTASVLIFVFYAIKRVKRKADKTAQG